MSAHVEGTIVQSTTFGVLVKYEYAPRDAQDERPWRALDVPAILIMLVGDENDEVRFGDDGIRKSIDDGELIIIHTP